MVAITELVPWLNAIQWRKLYQVTPEAIVFLEEHLRRERIVLRHLLQKKKTTPSEAHSSSLTEGDDGECAKVVLDKLSKEVDFSEAGVRESLYLIITSCYCWQHDHELSQFENPWEPLLGLIGMGYAVGFDEPPDGLSVELTVGCKNKTDFFNVI